MPWPVRGYFAIMVLRHAGIAWLIFSGDTEFPERSYRVIRDVSPLGRWAVIMVAIALVAAVAVVKADVRWARVAVVGSTGLTAAWAIGFWAARFEGSLLAPTAPIVWTALALKDLVVTGSDLVRPAAEVEDDG